MKSVMCINSPAENIMFYYSRDSRDKYLTQLVRIKLSRQQYAHSSKTLNRKNLAAVKRVSALFLHFSNWQNQIMPRISSNSNLQHFLIVVTPSLQQFLRCHCPLLILSPFSYTLLNYKNEITKGVCSIALRVCTVRVQKFQSLSHIQLFTKFQI